ncbi:MAG: hypothetical protein JWR23_709 [Mucilaginibacter sp.]|nr:hypothetical protein [Mucilaginibacter sp.]
MHFKKFLPVFGLFILPVIRAVEWLGTGKITYPKNSPTAASISVKEPINDN